MLKCFYSPKNISPQDNADLHMIMKANQRLYMH